MSTVLQISHLERVHPYSSPISTVIVVLLKKNGNLFFSLTGRMNIFVSPQNECCNKIDIQRTCLEALLLEPFYESGQELCKNTGTITINYVTQHHYLFSSFSSLYLTKTSLVFHQCTNVTTDTEWYYHKPSHYVIIFYLMSKLIWCQKTWHHWKFAKSYPS